MRSVQDPTIDAELLEECRLIQSDIETFHKRTIVRLTGLEAKLRAAGHKDGADGLAMVLGWLKGPDVDRWEATLPCIGVLLGEAARGTAEEPLH